MRLLLAVCFLSALPWAGASAADDDYILDNMGMSTEAVGIGEAFPDDDVQADIQESDEDLAGLVRDYIEKDVALKGAFFLEDPASGRVLKLFLTKVPESSSEGPDGSRIVEARFKDPEGKKYSALFHVRSAGFGGMDIFRIELGKGTSKK